MRPTPFRRASSRASSSGARLRGLFVCGAFALAASAATTQAATTNTYQAESASLFHAVVESTHAGFTGSGYVRFNDGAAGTVDFIVNAGQAGNHFVELRYANGSSARQPMAMSVNGKLVNGRVPGDPTGAWTTWATQGLRVQLLAGANTIRLESLAPTGGLQLDRINVGDQPPASADWSRMVVDSTIARMPDGVGVWEYSRALFLYGQYLAWRRVGHGDLNHPYMLALKNWVDSHVSANGTIDRGVDNLDNMMPANLCLLMHRHFGGTRYENCARNVRQVFNGYPRVDGGFWHSKSSSRANQLWLDGLFMGMPFLIRHGQEFDDANYANNETAQQLDIYARHTRRPSGLLRHAWYGGPESSRPSWADPTTGQAPEHWCRALGWFGVAHIEILDLLPASHPGRPALLSHLQSFVAALANTQDPVTGLWYQVMDKGSDLENWHETSCSSMHAYAILRAVEKGYVDAGFRANAERARAGVLSKLWVGTDGKTNISNICQGTNVGDLAYYLDRPRPPNDMHGLGAFLIMNEAFLGNSGWNGGPVPPVPITGMTVRDTANAGDWSIQSNLQSGNRTYGDRSYVLAAVPSTLLGSAWIRPAADSKSYAGNPLVSFSLGADADVRVAVDMRVPRPAWLDGSWAATGQVLTSQETATRTSSYGLYKKHFAAGPVALGPQANTSSGNYLVIVKASNASATNASLDSNLQ